MITTYKDFNKEDLGKFNLGDIVYCIDDDNSSYVDLIKDSRYEIIGIFKNSGGGGQGSWLYNIKPLDTDDYKKNFLLAEFFEDRFISELDYKANKYNL